MAARTIGCKPSAPTRSTDHAAAVANIDRTSTTYWG
jgi:hypothetical protein